MMQSICGQFRKNNCGSILELLPFWKGFVGYFYANIFNNLVKENHGEKYR